MWLTRVYYAGVAASYVGGLILCSDKFLNTKSSLHVPIAAWLWPIWLPAVPSVATALYLNQNKL